jgi:hypothetical protein
MAGAAMGHDEEAGTERAARRSCVRWRRGDGAAAYGVRAVAGACGGGCGVWRWVRLTAACGGGCDLRRRAVAGPVCGGGCGLRRRAVVGAAYGSVRWRVRAVAARRAEARLTEKRARETSESEREGAGARDGFRSFIFVGLRGADENS